MKFHSYRICNWPMFNYFKYVLHCFQETKWGGKENGVIFREGKYDNSGSAHWYPVHLCSTCKVNKMNVVLERKIYYKMMVTIEQVSKLHVPAGCVKDWRLYEPQGFCFYCVNTGWQETQPFQVWWVHRVWICFCLFYEILSLNVPK